MDIFKLGDKILALLEAMFGFWNNQISLVFAMLGQSPVSFKGGGPWAVIEGIEPIFVAVIRNRWQWDLQQNSLYFLLPV